MKKRELNCGGTITEGSKFRRKLERRGFMEGVLAQGGSCNTQEGFRKRRGEISKKTTKKDLWDLQTTSQCRV